MPATPAMQRRCMKKVNWDAIPSGCILGKLNVWTSARPQTKELVLDLRSMEELFGHREAQVPPRGRRTPANGHRGHEGSAVFSRAAQVSILDSKKSMNIAIFLKTFKRPVAEMVEDILQGDLLRFGTGKLRELCKLLPEACEVKKLCAFRGNISRLTEADQFMVQLVKVPGYEERLKSMVLREEFLPLMEEMKNSVDVMTKAANELLDCDDLHSVIRLVLKAGNYMNAGGHNGNAIGFRMNSLLRLADTKANKPAMNLMHFVAKQAEDIDAELLTFPSQLEHIGMASRICQEEVKADFEREVKKIEEVQLYANRQPGLLQQMETFLLRASMKLSDLSSSLDELHILSQAVAEYFCEDPNTFKLGDCCSVFHSFCQKFLTAIQENRNREAVELRRVDSARSSIKRRSTWSGREPRPPGKHDASSAALDTSAGDQETSGLESALHSFLLAAPVRRCRRNIVPVEMGPLAELSSTPTKTPPPPPGSGELDASLDVTPRQSSAEKRAKLREMRDQDLALAAKHQEEEAEKMRAVNRKLICFQNRLAKGTNAACLPVLELTPAALAVPETPPSMTRDYFLRSNEHSSSPWTIVSPFSIPDGKARPRTRRVPRLRRAFSISNAGDLDDSMWQMSPTPSSCSSTTVTPSTLCDSFALQDLTGNQGGGAGDFSPSCYPDPLASRGLVHDYLAQRPLSLGPLLRSCSLDETRRSPGPGSWLGELIHKSIRTKSCSSRSRMNSSTEEVFPAKEGSGSGLISFFRRFGNKSKPPDSRELKSGDSET